MVSPGTSFEERLFGPPIPGRECGNCTACCFEITIQDPKLEKPARQLCRHCGADGCAVYAARPESCRKWFCSWRRIADLSDDLRPDRCGLLVTIVTNLQAENPLARLYVIVQWVNERPITKSAAADSLLAVVRRYALPVWVGSGDRMSLHHPRDEIALHLVHGTVPPAAVATEVAAWRTRLPDRVIGPSQQ